MREEGTPPFPPTPLVIMNIITQAALSLVQLIDMAGFTAASSPPRSSCPRRVSLVFACLSAVLSRVNSAPSSPSVTPFISAKIIRLIRSAHCLPTLFTGINKLIFIEHLKPRCWQTGAVEASVDMVF